MRSWLKAGLIGGAILIVLDLLGLIGLVAPAVGQAINCCVAILFFVTYLGTGVLAALWLVPPRTAGEGAQAGVLAGLLAGGIDTVFTVLENLVLSLTGLAQRYYLEQLPREAIRMLGRMRLSQFFSPGGIVAASLCGSICGLVVAAVLGAIGGAVLAALKQE